ncbi:MAG: Hsp20/alpha crystallin family protein [Thermoanaerobaculia bacterium]
MANPRQDNPQQHPTERERTARNRDIEKRQHRENLPTARYSPARYFDPFEVMRSMRDEMDRIFDTFSFGTLGRNPALPTEQAARHWSPQIEMFERGNRLVVRADLPGMKKDDVSVEIENDVLRLEGERTSESREEKEGFFHTERSYGHFYRAIPLPEGVHGENARANFHDGVLEIEMDAPKQTRENRRRIDVK